MSIHRKAHSGGVGYSLSTSVQGPGELIYVSGVIGTFDTLAEQTSSCFDQIEQALAAHGATLASVVRITSYLTSLDEYGDFSRIRGERFGEDLPSSTAVQVAGLLFDGLIEIDAIAFLPA